MYLNILIKYKIIFYINLINRESIQDQLKNCELNMLNLKCTHTKLFVELMMFNFKLGTVESMPVFLQVDFYNVLNLMNNSYICLIYTV